jgi:hypothetical protein
VYVKRYSHPPAISSKCCRKYHPNVVLTCKLEYAIIIGRKHRHEDKMLPKKLRTAKIQQKILQPEGVETWQAPTVARGIVRTSVKWLEGQDEVWVDDLDIAIIRAACQHLREGAAGIGWQPLRKGACGNEARVNAEYLRYLLGAS